MPCFEQTIRGGNTSRREGGRPSRRRCRAVAGADRVKSGGLTIGLGSSGERKRAYVPVSILPLAGQGNVSAATVEILGSASSLGWPQHFSREYFTTIARAVSGQVVRVCADLSHQLAGALQIQLKRKVAGRHCSISRRLDFTALRMKEPAMLIEDCPTGSGEDPFELSGFVTRHRLSLVFEDWRVLSDLLAWLLSENARLVSMRQSEPICGQSEATLLVEGIRAHTLNEWLRRAQEDRRMSSARLEHLLTSIDPFLSAIHSAEFSR